jgi:hypothetical protein
VELSSPPTPVWCIISVYRPELLGEARKRLGELNNVEIIVDRRVGERRRPERAESAESRGRDRRRRYHVDEQLRRNGFVIVPRDAHAGQ